MRRFAKSRLAGALVVSAALLVPLGVFGGSALARTASAVGEYGKSGSAQYQYRITVCHRTGSKHHPWHLITISSSAVSAHLRHGDVMAPCPTTAPVFQHGHHGQNDQGSKKDDDDHGGQDHGNHGHHK